MTEVGWALVKYTNLFMSSLFGSLIGKHTGKLVRECAVIML